MLGLAGPVAALVSTPVPLAAAQPPPPPPACSDVQVVFARGTGEPAGVGGAGQAFVDQLRVQAAPRSVDVYPVNYLASGNFVDRIPFAQTVVDGIRDAAQKVESTAAACPDTDIVLGGYSQGAAVAGYVTAAEIPKEVPVEYHEFIPEPMSDEVGDHVAAVVLFGRPSDRFLTDADAPPIVIGPSYQDETLSLCAEGDTVCNGAPIGIPSFAHTTYHVNGMATEGAAYAVARLGPAPAPPAPAPAPAPAPLPFAAPSPVEPAPAPPPAPSPAG